MRILIVAPWLPHPKIAHAGGQNLHHTVRSLVARGHEVHLVCYGRTEPEEEVQPLRALCNSLHVVTPSYSWRQKAERLFSGGLRRPWTLGRRSHAEARSLIRGICRDRGIDVVHFVWTEMGRYLNVVPGGVGTVLGTQDVESLVRPREVGLHRAGWGRLQAALRARRLTRAERRYVRQAHVTLASSQADRQALARLGEPSRVHVVHPWVDGEAVAGVKREAVVPGRLVFMGAMDRVANVAAARFLLQCVWPGVRCGHPGSTLRIVGANPPHCLRRQAERDPRLTVTGYVPDLAGEWAASDVAVSPSLTGGGLLVKVAQPMAAGRPVVTTTLGNEGVGAPVGVAVEVADDPAGFTAAVLRLLSDRDHWVRVAEGGRRHVSSTLDWSASLRHLEKAHESAVDRARRAV